MGKGGSAQQQVTDYYLSLHLGVAVECDSVTGIYLDKKTIWEGEASAPTVLGIDLPNLNGGPKQEGGAVGNIYVLPGRSDQVLPDDIAGRMNNGQPGSNTPAFRGITSLFFAGSASGTTFLELLGEALTNSMPFRGFKWSSNNPIVAQNLSSRVKRAPKGLDPTIAMMTSTVDVVTITHVDNDNNTTQSKYVVGTDSSSIQTFEGDTSSTSTMVVNLANPAHIIFEAMTNKAWGMGAPTVMFDLSIWGSAAQQLYNEGLGLSLMWAKQSTIKDFVNKVLDHIQGVVFVDPQTGLWNLKLIRADYDVETLPVFDPSNATLKGFSQKSWGETINEIAATWTNPLNEESETVSVQDLANISIQGATVSDTRDYPGVRTAALATQLAARDCRSSAAPLRSMDLEVDRSAWNRKPGDCIVVNWPEKRITGAVMRVMKVDRGKKSDPSIKLTLLEDIFSLDHAVITPAPGSAWVDPTEAPTPIDDVSIITIPAFFSLTADFQAAQIDLQYPEVRAMVLGYKQSREVHDFDLYTPKTDSTGSTSFSLAGTKTVVERSVLAADLASEVTSAISNKLVIYPNRGPIPTGFVFIGANDSDYEIALVSDTSGGVITLQRGVLDTVPKAWPAGSPIWFANIGQRLVDEAVIRSAGETVQYKLSPRTSIGALPLADSTTFNQTLTARPYLPLRPANVKVNGVAFGSLAIGTATVIAVSWSTRNRTLEDGQALLWTDGPVAPEYRQGTVVTVKDVTSGAVVYEQPGLWTEDSLDLPAAWFARYSAVDITVSSRRDDLDSLQGFTLRVTGLPGNGAADPPPAPPALTDPPSPAAGPAIGAWEAFGTSVIGGSLTEVAAIQVVGTPDNAAAEDLIIRYQKSGDSAWSVAPLVALNNLYLSTYVTGVASNTVYDVQIAYQIAYGLDGTLLTQWTDLGTVTTGNSTVDNALALGGRIAADVLSDLDGAVAAGDALTTQLAAEIDARQTEADSLAESAIAAALQGVDTTGYVDRQTHVGGDSLVSIINLIGIVEAGAFVIDESTVQLSGDGSTVAQRFSAVNISVGNVSTSVSNEITDRINGDNAQATTTALLTATVGANNSASLSFQSAQASTNSATAASISGLTASVGTNSAAISSEATTRSDAISAEAAARLAVKATVDGHTSSISLIFDTLNGNQATAILALNVGGHVTGFMVNGALQQFAILASQFAVVDPSGVGGPTTPILYSGGVTYLNSSVYAQSLAANSVVAGNIQADQISTAHLVGAAVTNVLASNQAAGSNNLSTTEQTFWTASYTTSVAGATHLINLNALFDTGAAPALVSIRVRLYRDGTLIGEVWGNTSFFWASGTLSDNPSAGAHTYTVTCATIGAVSGAHTTYILGIITELKR